jgi:hypothetical protein
MLRRVVGVVYLVLSIVFGLSALFLSFYAWRRWPELLFVLLLALGAVVSFRLARESFTASRRKAARLP